MHSYAYDCCTLTIGLHGAGKLLTELHNWATLQKKFSCGKNDTFCLKNFLEIVFGY